MFHWALFSGSLSLSALLMLAIWMRAFRFEGRLRCGRVFACKLSVGKLKSVRSKSFGRQNSVERDCGRKTKQSILRRF